MKTTKAIHLNYAAILSKYHVGHWTNMVGSIIAPDRRWLMASRRSEGAPDKLDQLSGKIHIGVDVHKKTYHVAARGSNGQIFTWVCPAQPECLISRLEQTKERIAQVVYESGPTGFCLARAMQENGYPTMVVAPSRMPRPVTRHSKTDRLDCKRLAEYSSKGMLRPVSIPTHEEESERSIIRLRHQTMDNLRKTKQRIKSFLLFQGIEEPQGLLKWTNRAKKRTTQPSSRSGFEIHPPFFGTGTGSPRRLFETH